MNAGRAAIPPPASMPQRIPAMLGNPAALGWAAFGLTIFMQSCYNTGMLNDSTIFLILPIAFFYGGIVQILAGMWEYAVANTFNATTFLSYGAFWLAYATYQRYVAPEWVVNHVSDYDVRQAVGVFFLAWFIFTCYMSIASIRVSKAVFIVYLLLDVTFLLQFVASFAHHNIRTQRTAGWLGIFTAAAAWYVSAASLINASWRQNLVPTLTYVHAQQGEPYMHGQPEDPYLHGHKGVVFAHGPHEGHPAGPQQLQGGPAAPHLR